MITQNSLNREIYFRDRVSIPTFWGAGGKAGEGRYGPEASQAPRWSLFNRVWIEKWYFRDRVSIPRFWGAGGKAGEGRYGPEASQAPRWSLFNRVWIEKWYFRDRVSIPSLGGEGGGERRGGRGGTRREANETQKWRPYGPTWRRLCY